jgi:Protein of unknown function (DUF3131)
MRIKVNRRGFLQLLAPPLLLPATAFRVGAQAATDALFVLVDGIGPATPVDRLHAFVEPFLDGEIPIGLVMQAPSGSDPNLSFVVAEELRRNLAASPAMVEPVLYLPGLSALPPYFQRRATSDGLHWFRGVIDGRTDNTQPVTIATDAPVIADFDALRCLGIRNVLSLGTPSPVVSTGCANLEVCLYGATTISVAETANPALPVRAALDGPGWAQIVFSLAAIEQVSVADARLRGQRAIDAIVREMELGRRFMALPRNHALWFGEDQSRYVAIRLEAASEGSVSAIASFKADLQALGIPFSDTFQPAAPDGEPWPEAACLNIPLSSQIKLGTKDMPWPKALRCAVASTLTDSRAPALLPVTEAEIDLLLLPTPHVAFNDRGLLVRNETAIADAASLLEERDLMRDAVLSISVADYQTPVALAATLETLRRFRDDPATEIVDIPGFLRATVAPDPVFDLHRESRRDAVEQADPEPLSAEEWMADARQAWTFFERFSIPSTGLCADTAEVQDGDEWLHRELTMWDIGSLIAGVMAAHELGLIQNSEFIARAEKLVRALPVARIGGRRLPSDVISSDTGASLSNDFNACDTGRLLSVLRELDAHPLTLGIAAKKTDQWELESVVVGGHVHSVVRGVLVDRFRSHCAHYTSRAFRDRGVDALSPYDVQEVASKTDREMLLLHSLGDLGALGAEPLLFEALEMGMSEPSNLLASVLFSAQRHAFERTKTLYCVSEAPLNRAPWFSYQGLNVTSAEERWMVTAVSDDPQFDTPEFRRETALVNTKAAYLWAAHKPGPYSTLLARHVRARARLDDMGFSPGVFMATGEGMPGYADVNTNGIVLEAIAFIMRGRKPRLT